jgi:hypothetical protein
MRLEGVSSFFTFFVTLDITINHPHTITTTMAPPPPSTILPALSIALGLPLCHRVAADTDESSTSATKATTTNHAVNVKNNLSRIYARRLMNRAELEQSHPWRLDESPSPRGRMQDPPPSDGLWLLSQMWSTLIGSSSSSSITYASLLTAGESCHAALDS